MKVRTFLVAVVGALSLLSAFGFVEELYLQEWAGGDRPLPGGWTHKKLIKGDGGAYFSSREGWLQSPVFDAAIRTVKIEVYSTVDNPTRKLYLHPMTNGVTEEGQEISPTEATAYAIREFPIEQYAANQFVIQFAPEGSSGNWWIRKVEVRFGDPGTDDVDAPRSWSLSAFVPRPGFRAVDFSVLGYVKADTANSWRNGLTIEGFHAFSDSGPCENIRLGNSSSPNFGLYAIAVDDAGSSAYALSVLGTSGSTMCLMLPIALDVERPLAQLSVEYRVWELSVEGRSSTLSFSYRTLDDLATMSAKDAVWESLSNADWSTGKDACGSSRTIELPVKNLRGAKFVCLRWSVQDKPNSSIVGISDVRVTGAVVPSGFMLTIR